MGFREENRLCFQTCCADAALAAWQDGAWPAGLLTYHCLLGEDGSSLLHYQ